MVMRSDGGGRFDRRAFVTRSGAVLAGVPLVLAGCGGARSSTSGKTAADGPPRAGGTLRYGAVGRGQASTLDPFRWTSEVELAAQSWVYDGLWSIGADGGIEPGLVERWEANGDATAWTLRLRSGVRFHDGAPFGSADVLHTLRLAAGERYASTNAVALDLDACRAPDERTVVLVSKRPNAELPGDFALPSDLPVVKRGTRTFSHPNGTGPMRYRSGTPVARIQLARNDAYWGERPHLDGVTIVPVNDEQARVNGVLAGSIDVAVTIGATAARRLRGSNRAQLVEIDGAAAVAFYMRVDRPPFDRVEVRQAMRLAIDRETCVRVAQQGFGEVGNDLFGPAAASYAGDLPQRAYDVERAKSLLAQAGHPDGIDVELVTSRAFPSMLESAQVFKESAAPAGIRIALRQVPEADLFNPEAGYLDWPLGMSFWNGLPFERHATEALLPGATYNETHWSDERWAQGFLEARATRDDSRRIARYRELQKTLYDEGGYIVWGFQPVIHCVGPRVHGFAPYSGTSRGPVDIRRVWLDA